MQHIRNYRQKGFTVVEILVILVVISVLTGIIIVSYGTYQERTRDAQRKSDVAQIAAALKSYANWKNTYAEAADSCGKGTYGVGWVAIGAADDATYNTNSILTCLTNEKLLKPGEGIDPSGCKKNSGGVCGSGNPTKAYMKTTCLVSGTIRKTYVMAYLETAPANNAAIDALCGSGWGTAYGMNYYVEAS